MSQAAHSNPAMRGAADHGAYTKPAIAMHWIVALLIFAAFGLGLYMTDIPGFTPTKLKLFSYHKWIGITVLIFAVLRVLWRLTHPAPALCRACRSGNTPPRKPRTSGCIF